MNIRERYLTLSGLLLCLFEFSLAQDIVTINIDECQDNNSTLDLRHVRNAIVRAEGTWPRKCDIFLGDSLDESIVISFYQHNLNVNDVIVFRDTQGTELWITGKGRYESGEKSFIFKGPVKIHYGSYRKVSSLLTVKLEFVFTITHDFLCTTEEFECTNRQCIAKHLVCDKRNNCGDRSDEIGCKQDCTENEFHCNNTKCIPNTKICNGHNDCGDMSDEEICNQECEIGKEWKCNNTRCISNFTVCDDKNDCGDWSDETNCHRYCDFRCRNGKCLHSWLKCNGRDDCGDMSDELICRKCLVSYEFRCKNMKCIPQSLVCNYRDDCGDNSDESGCGECYPWDFQCSNGRCVFQLSLCNNLDECGDFSDEKDCVPCLPRDFRCSKTKCIPDTLVCDRKDDCGDNSDEYCYHHVPRSVKFHWVITIMVCTAVLAILVVILAAILIRKKIKHKKKPQITKIWNDPTKTNAQNAQRPNLFGRVRQSFRSGRESAPSYPNTRSDRTTTCCHKTFQAPSMYPHVHSGVDNPEFKAEE